jgi:uncharacterized protein (DUF433 family)
MLEETIVGGTGLYTLAEASKYARMSRMTLSRWFKGDGYCERVFAVGETKVITFADFVQALAVRNLRLHYNVPLQKIRAAVELARKDYGMDYPFARENTTYLFENEIWIKPERSDLVQVSGKQHHQSGMTRVIAQFYKDVSFDPATGLADKYKAFERGGLKITMNPRLRLGEPMVDGCGYTPQALAEAAKAEGSTEEAARMYGVTKEQVEICLEYIDYLQAA